MNKELNVDAAIDLLKSGRNLDEITISDPATSKVQMMDALLLARNGYVVPEDNVVYDDDQIQYDPDFDDMTWGKPVPFKNLLFLFIFTICASCKNNSFILHDKFISNINKANVAIFENDFNKAYTYYKKSLQAND